jgi:hypothetical protein
MNIDEVINVDFKNIDGKSLVIVNLTGSIILEKNVNSVQSDLQNSNNLEAGIYFAQVSRDDGVVLT